MTVSQWMLCVIFEMLGRILTQLDNVFTTSCPSLQITQVAVMRTLINCFFNKHKNRFFYTFIYINTSYLVFFTLCLFTNIQKLSYLYLHQHILSCFFLPFFIYKHTETVLIVWFFDWYRNINSCVQFATDRYCYVFFFVFIYILKLFMLVTDNDVSYFLCQWHLLCHLCQHVNCEAEKAS